MSKMSGLHFVVLLIGGTVMVASQPADLGTFGSHNDLPNGISSFSLPAEERIISEPFVLAFINYTYTSSEGIVVQTNAEERGKYGEGRIFNVRGLLVHITSKNDVNDHTACDSPLRGTNGQPLPTVGSWVALIKRGGCNFEDKVRHAHDHKALGVIVYNDRESIGLDKMKIVDTDRK